MLTRPKRPIKPLPYWAYSLPAIVLALVGLVATVYLAVSHYRVHTDFGYQSFCAISQSMNCDTVSQSAYAVLLGMPLAVWGMLGYLWLTLLLLWASLGEARPKRLWTLIQVSAALFCAIDLYLAWVSSRYIKSYCLLCILTYAVNFGLLYLAWLIRRRFGDASLFASLRSDAAFLFGHRRWSLVITTIFIGMMVIGMSSYPRYWQYQLPGVNENLMTGLTPEGRAWIGAEQPQLVIEEYSDYLCFQCAKMHGYLRQLVSEYPDKVRLVHFNFPMDHQYNPIVRQRFHDGAGRMALLALYAKSKGKFWEMNDRLFEMARSHEPVGMRSLAESFDLDLDQLARCHQDPDLLQALWSDIRSGLKLRIKATPSFVINGEVFQGTLPPHILTEIIN